jgi:hypothetical protein
MAKGKKKIREKARTSEPKGVPADLEDEVDLFHKGRDKIHLDKSQDTPSDESAGEDDVDIYSLAGSDDDDSEDGGGRLAECELFLPCLVAETHDESAVCCGWLDHDVLSANFKIAMVPNCNMEIALI